MYLGLDLSLTGTGLCLIHPDYSIESTSLIHNVASDDVTRLFLNQTDLEAFLNSIKEQVTLCCIEGPAFSVRDGGHLFQIGEWTGVAKLVLYNLNIPFIIAAPLQLKKYISGTGKNVRKELIMLDIYKKYGEELRDNNIADAYVLSRIARDYDYVSTAKSDCEDLFKYQKEVIDVLIKSNKESNKKII